MCEWRYLCPNRFPWRWSPICLCLSSRWVVTVFKINGIKTGIGFKIFLNDRNQGFTGLTCQFLLQNTDYCKPNPCKNGGTCINLGSSNTGSSYACVCPAGSLLFQDKLWIESERTFFAGKKRIYRPSVYRSDPEKWSVQAESMRKRGNMHKLGEF